jgi:hypothetical protein
MSGPEQAAREATLEAVHSDQLRLQEQLEELGGVLTRIEQHLMGGPQLQMIGAAQAQAAALDVRPGAALGVGPGTIAAALPPPGKLPQMCELGVNNSQKVSDMFSRLTHLTGLLGVPN